MRRIGNEYKTFLIALGSTIFILGAISAAYFIYMNHLYNFNTKDTKRKTAPKVSLPDQNGKSYDLRNFNQPGMIVFWTSWCSPCQRELRELEKTNLGDMGYIAINGDEKHEDAIEFISKNSIKRPLILFDPNSKAINVPGYPTVFVNFGDGTWSGGIGGGTTEEMLNIVQHTLARDDFRPYQISQKIQERFWSAINWRYFNVMSTIGFSLFFGILLALMWTRHKTSKLLIGTLYAYTIDCQLKGWDIFNPIEEINLKGYKIGQILGALYYSPALWLALIGIGILLYLRRFLTHDNGT